MRLFNVTERFIVFLFTTLLASLITNSSGRKTAPAQIEIPRREVRAGTDVMIKCHIDYPSESSAKSTDATWLRDTGDGRAEIISTGNVKHHGDPRYSVSTEHFDRSPHTDYKLSIRQARRSDSGKYICEISKYGWDTEGELTVV